MSYPADASRLAPPTRWTSLNIALHWIILGLVIVQFIDHEWMVDLFEHTREGVPSDRVTTFMGYGHMVIGVLILVSIATRLWDRFAHGRPAHSAAEPGWAVTLSKIVHFAIYAVLLVMPLAGALAWFTGSERIGAAHGTAWSVLMVLVGVHILGALANQFWFRTDVLRRMMPGQGRKNHER